MSSHREAPRRAQRPLATRVGSVMLTITAAIGTLCIVATLAAVLFDVKPLVFRSGSMSPDIATGALGISRTTDAGDIRIGDVVSVKNASGVRVTHRVVTTSTNGDSATLVLKGDANASPDSEPYVVKSAERVMFDIPRAGYVVSWVSGPIGVFIGGLVVGGSALLVFGSAMRRDQGGARRAVAVVSVLALGAGASASLAPEGTLAAFTDNATMTSGSVTSYKVPAPVVSSCNDAGTSVVITWPAVSSPYPVTYTARIVGPNTALTVTTAGANRQVSLSPALFASGSAVRLTTVLTSNYTSTSTDEPITYGFLGLSVNCG